MSEKAKIIIGVVTGVVGAIILFCLIVIIGCSINGLTFGEQVCKWFGANKNAVKASKDIALAISKLPVK